MEITFHCTDPEPDRWQAALEYCKDMLPADGPVYGDVHHVYINPQPDPVWFTIVTPADSFGTFHWQDPTGTLRDSEADSALYDQLQR